MKIILMIVMLALNGAPYSNSSQAPSDALGRDRERIQRLKAEFESYSPELRTRERYQVAIELTRGILKSLETTQYRQRAYLSLGDLAKRMDDDEAAAHYYRTGLKIDEDGNYARSLRISLSKLLVKAGRFEDAKDLLKSPAESASVIPQEDHNLSVQPFDLQVLFELRAHAKSAALSGDIDAAIYDFKLGVKRYPAHSKVLGNLATTVAELLSTHSDSGKVATEQFYKTLTVEAPALLDSELFLSNTVVSAKRLGLKEVLIQRVATYEQEFPNSDKVPYFLMWAADISEGKDRAAFLQGVVKHPSSTDDMIRAARKALGLSSTRRDSSDLTAPNSRDTSWTTIIVAVNIGALCVIIGSLVLIKFRRSSS